MTEGYEILKGADSEQGLFFTTSRNTRYFTRYVMKLSGQAKNKQAEVLLLHTLTELAGTGGDRGREHSRIREGLDGSIDKYL